jgi:hypothetical protein
MVLSTRLILAFTILCCIDTSALDVRVESPSGAPRIVVDGKPVRARMFFGGPGWSALGIGPEWKQLEFEFTALGAADNGTMHLRFGPSAGDVWLDDLQVEDLTGKDDLIPLNNFENGDAGFDRDWSHWPTDKSNTVGAIAIEPKAGRDGSAGLHVRLTAPPDGQWPDFHLYHRTNLHIISGHRYRVRVWTKATPARSLNVEFHRPGKPFVRLGGPPDPFVAQIKMAGDVGVNFVTFPVSLPWPKPGQPEDWEAVDARCQTVLNANPNALLIPRVPMNPPPWWRESHPDEMMQWEDGHRALAVPASPVYRHDAAERLTAFIEHVEAKFGEHVAGYHPDGQNTGEWFYEDSWKKPLNGYAPADLKAWRLWLKDRYRTDDALRAAWHDATATLDKADVPSAASRHAAPAGVFRDPATEQAIIDWGRFQQDAMAQCVCDLAHAARTATKGRKLVLFFYGYVHELSGMFNGPYTSGHYALRRVLNSPDIDILCGPIAYFDRGIGGTAPSMSAAESVALAGKMWLNEDDTHTYLATGAPPGFQDHVNTLEATNAELIRNVAQESLRNFATWWMDLTQTGWFKDAAMWDQMKKLGAIDEGMLAKPTPFHPEVAAVVDEVAMERVAAGSQNIIRACAYEARQKLGRMGAPYGQYLLDDVLAGKVKAKLYLMMNTWSLSATQRVKLLEVTKGSVCVWCYAPGWFDGEQISLEAMQQLTGFKLEPQHDVKAWATPSDDALTQPIGVQQVARPLFAVADAKPGEVLAKYGNGSSAVALRGNSLFVGAPGVTSELLRLAARKAGVHLFAETDCNVYANGPFMALHGAEDGPVSINTGHSQPVVDLLSGETLGNGPKLTLSLRRGETRVLRIAP